MFAPASYNHQGALYRACVSVKTDCAIIADFALDSIMIILVLGNSPLKHHFVLMDVDCTKGQVVRK